MAISPGSDIVMDVIRAADPARAARAAARLERVAVASARQTDAGAWERALTAAGNAPARTAGSESITGIRPPLSAKNADPSRSMPNEAETRCGCGLADAPSWRRASMRSEIAPRGESERAKMRRAYAGLESLLVRQMLETALKGGGDALFGSGLSGAYWKSFMAQAVAQRIADAGGLGLAAALAATPALPGEASGVKA